MISVRCQNIRLYGNLYWISVRRHEYTRYKTENCLYSSVPCAVCTLYILLPTSGCNIDFSVDVYARIRISTYYILSVHGAQGGVGVLRACPPLEPVNESNACTYLSIVIYVDHAQEQHRSERLPQRKTATDIRKDEKRKKQQKHPGGMQQQLLSQQYVQLHRCCR